MAHGGAGGGSAAGGRMSSYLEKPELDVLKRPALWLLCDAVSAPKCRAHADNIDALLGRAQIRHARLGDLADIAERCYGNDGINRGSRDIGERQFKRCRKKGRGSKKRVGGNKTTGGRGKKARTGRFEYYIVQQRDGAGRGGLVRGHRTITGSALPGARISSSGGKCPFTGADHPLCRNYTNSTRTSPRLHRSSTAKNKFLEALGYTYGAPAGYHVDHVVPLCEGGADCPCNMQLLDEVAHKEKTRKDCLSAALLGTPL